MNIPARSFIRSGKDKSAAGVGKMARTGVNDLVQKNLTAESFLQRLGEIGVERTLKNFDKVRTPALSAKYASRRKPGKILVQEQKLRDSISYKIVPAGSDE